MKPTTEEGAEPDLMAIDQKSQTASDGIGLQEIRRGLARLSTIVRKNAFIVLGTIAMCLGFVVGAEVLTPTKYLSELRFVVSDKDSGTPMGVAGLASQFGIGIGGNSGLSLDRIVAIGKSERVFRRSTLSAYSGRDSIFKSLGEKILEVYGEQLKVSKPLFGEQVMTKEDRKEIRFNLMHDLVFGAMGEGGLASMLYDEDAEVVIMRAETVDHRLSYGLLESTYEELQKFYTISVTSQKAKTLETLTVKADSLANRIDELDVRIAAIRDKSRGIFLDRYTMELTRLERDRSLTQVVYGEVLKNKVATEFALDSTTPVFSIITKQGSSPIVINRRIKLKILITMIVGFIIGVAVASFAEA